MTKTKTMFGLLLVLLTFGALAHLSHANSADASLEALFGPAVGDPEVVDSAEFQDVDVLAPFTPEELGVSDEEMKAPVYHLASDAPRAAAESVAPLEVEKNNRGFCRGVARLEDAQRDSVVRTYMSALLRATDTRDPGFRIRDCVVRQVESLSHSSRLACIVMPTEDAEKTTLIDALKSEFTSAIYLCATVSPITDRQIKDAFTQLLHDE